MTRTHLSNLSGKIVERTQHPLDPQEGEIYVNVNSNVLHVRAEGAWYGRQLSTTTSTSTTSTTTSSSSSSSSTTSTSSSTTMTTTSTSTTTSL